MAHLYLRKRQTVNVIVYGMLASMVWGLIWYLLRPYFG